MLILGLLVALACSAPAPVCRTYNDVIAPLTVVGSSLSELEQGGPNALSTASGAAMDRVVRSAQAVLDCAGASLPGLMRVAPSTPVARFDARCDDAWLQNPASVGDPCCNATLRQTQCCLTRAYNYATSALMASVDPQALNKCGSPSNASFFLGQFQRLYNPSFDGECDIESGDLSVQSVDEAMGVVRLCNELVHRADLLCGGHEDCWSGVCLVGRCVPDGTRSAQLLLQCVISQLSSDLRPLLRVQLGLAVSSLDADLETAFVAAVTNGVCELIPWDSYPFFDSRFAFVEPQLSSQDLCTAVSVVSCEDGKDILGCESRVVCVYDWPDDSSGMSSIVVNSSVCVPGLCSNPDVPGTLCGTVSGCSVKGATNSVDCSMTGQCSDVGSVWSGGLCVLPFSPTGGELNVCGSGLVVLPLGCGLVNATLQSCPGQWLTPSVGRDACLAAQLCTAGAVAASPVWSWTPGVWGVGTISVPLTQRNAQFVPQHRWVARVDWTKVSTLLSSVFTQQTALRMGSLMRCRLVPALAILRSALCDCSALQGRPPSSSCWDAGSPLVLGVRQLAKGTAGAAVMTTGSVTWFLSSCVDDTMLCVLEFGILLRPGRSTNPLDSREQIYDSFGSSRVVGVALSDLLYVGMSPLLRGGIELCADITMLTANCSSCEPFFGVAATSTAPLVLNRQLPVVMRDRSVKIRSTANGKLSFCGTVDAPGFYAATLVAATASSLCYSAALATFLFLLLLA